jgi:hypothetical protein
MFGVPLSLLSVALSVSLVFGAVFYFYYSPIYEHDITVLGADITALNPNWATYSTNTTEIIELVSFTDLKTGGGNWALDDVVLIAVDSAASHNMPTQDMELRIAVDKPDANLIVNVTMYWVAYWYNSVPNDVASLFVYQATQEIAVDAATGEVVLTILNADWTSKMIYGATQQSTEPTGAANHGLLLDFDFSRDGADWGDHTINMQIFVGIDE